MAEITPTLSFDELWRSPTRHAWVYLDQSDPIAMLLRVHPPDGAGSTRMVLQEVFVRKAEKAPVGWLESGRLVQATTTGSTDAVLAVDREWFDRQLRENSATAPTLQLLISADRRASRKVTLTLEPRLLQIIPPEVNVVWSKPLSLDGESRQEYVELARLEFVFDPLVRFYGGEVPALGIIARPAMAGVTQSIDCRLVQDPPDLDGGLGSRIEGSTQNNVTGFVTGLPISEDESTTFRLMAGDSQLRTAILQHRKPTASDSVCTATLSVDLSCAMEFTNSSEPLVQRNGNVQVSFFNEQTITVSLPDESAAIVLRENGKHETYGTRLIAQYKSETVLMQKSFGMSIRYNGMHQTGKLALRWFVIPEEQEPHFDEALTPDLILPADGATHHCLAPIRQLLDAAIDRWGSDFSQWSCVVQVELRTSDDGPGSVTTMPSFRVPILIDSDPDWVLCVDLGTSAVAAWCGVPNSGVVQSMHQLPLGAWLEQIDHAHDESREATQTGSDRRDSTSRQTISRLLPSHIGLASDFNLRDKFDVLSLGDLRAGGSAPNAVHTRLKMRGRHYDLSVPFPSSDRMHEYFDHILFELKRKLITCNQRNWMIDIGADVLALPPSAGTVTSQNRVNLLDIFTDYFDELATYVIPRVLEWAAKELTSAEGSAFRKDLEHWLEGPSNLQLIITHPTGMSSEKRRLYQIAAERFATSLQTGGSHAGALPKPSVVLIPESLAAARFGISRLLEQSSPGNAAAGERLFVTLDIGAGTYDVTVLSAQIEQGDPVDWRIHSHFGVAVGGIELDRSLTARIAEVFQRASEQSALKRRFKFVDFGLPSCVADVARIRDEGEKRIGMRFLNAVKAAKARLTAEIMSRPEQGTYRWDEKSSFALTVKLSEQENLQTQLWPLSTREMIAGETFDIEGEPGAFLRVGADQSVWLLIQRNALQGGELGNWLKVLGQLIPGIARAAARKYSPDQVPHWIVTGRTALWPDLYSAITEVAKDARDGQPGLVAAQPYAANDMKVAVIQGAQMLASEPHLDTGNRVFNPLAIVRMAARPGGGNRITSIDYIEKSENPKGEVLINEAITRFQLVRAVPCLDRRDARSGKTMLELLNEIADCPPLWRPVSHVRDLKKAYPDGVSKIWWETDSERRTTIRVLDKKLDVLEVFGPFSEETVYVYQ